MERSMVHEFFLVKAVDKGTASENDNCNETLHMYCSGYEGRDYVEVDSAWFHNEFMEYIWLSLEGFAVKLNFTGPPVVIEEAPDLDKLERVCSGWVMVLKEFPEKFELGAWDDVFIRDDLIEELRKLEEMAKTAAGSMDHIILYAGI